MTKTMSNWLIGLPFYSLTMIYVGNVGGNIWVAGLGLLAVDLWSHFHALKFYSGKG